MKKINLEKLINNWQVELVGFIFSVVMTVFSWWQVSPQTLAHFVNICEANGEEYCMYFYRAQVKYYWILFVIFLAMSAILGIILGAILAKSKHEKRKHKK